MTTDSEICEMMKNDMPDASDEDDYQRNEMAESFHVRNSYFKLSSWISGMQQGSYFHKEQITSVCTKYRNNSCKRHSISKKLS